MCYYIGVEDLAANALIELIQKYPGTRSVSFKQLDQYGIAVSKVIVDYASGEEGILLIDRSRIFHFARECSDLISIKGYGTKDARLELKGDKTDQEFIDELIDRFCGTISVPVLKAMSAPNSLEALFGALV